MACEKRPFLCGILTLGMLALFFHLVGFAAPGWLIMRLSFMEESRQTAMFQTQIIDHGGVKAPEEPENPLDKMKKLRKRRSEEEVEIVEEELIEENNILDQWIIETTVLFYHILLFISPVYLCFYYHTFIYGLTFRQSSPVATEQLRQYNVEQTTQLMRKLPIYVYKTVLLSSFSGVFRMILISTFVLLFNMCVFCSPTIIVLRDEIL
jgi:hypothetical protein